MNNSNAANPLHPQVEVPSSPVLEGGAGCTAGSVEEVEAEGKRSDMDVDGCGSSKHA